MTGAVAQSTAPTRRRAVRAAAWVATAPIAAAALLGGVAPWLGGDAPGWDGWAGYAAEAAAALWLPIGLLALAAGVPLLLLHRPAGLLLLGCGAGIAAVEFGPTATADNPGAADTASPPPLRLATVNPNADQLGDPSLRTALQQLNADVLVLPECGTAWTAILADWFPADYPHRFLAAATPRNGAPIEGLAMAIWSRHPAAGAAQIETLGAFQQLRVPLRWRGRVLAVYGIHPRRPHPLALYRLAHRDRRALLAWIDRDPLPVVVAGDFNAPPRSAFLARLHDRGLVSSAAAAGGRAPGTWPMDRGVPQLLRIAVDHVLHSPALVTTAFALGQETRSDHRGIVASLQWRE